MSNELAKNLVRLAKALMSKDIVATSIPSFKEFVKEHVVDDYPYGSHRTKATFKVEGNAGRQRVSRVTIDPVRQRPNSPKATTYGPAATIGIGAHDGHVYPIVGRPGQIAVWSGDMKHTLGAVFPKDPQYNELAQALGFRAIPDSVTVKDTENGAQVDGLQGKSMTLREIMNAAGLSNEVISAEVQNVVRKPSKDMMSDIFTVNFKPEANKGPFVIQVYT